MTERIGFIGLGIMGKPMVRNLLAAGQHVQVYARNAEAASDLKDAGASVADTLAELATQNDIIIAMLPDSPQVRDVALGANGLIDGLSQGKLFIDMSTIDADTELDIQRRFNAVGTDTLDAPVSGGESGAKQRTLSIMAGGPEPAFSRALPLFRLLGKRIVHMGPTGSGQITKSCNQIATALATQGVVEAFTLANKAGVDLVKLREVMMGGFADSKALQVAGDKMIRRDFTPGFKLRLYQKDLRIAQAAAALYELALPGTRLLFEEMTNCLETGKGDFDFSALVQLFEESPNTN